MEEIKIRFNNSHGFELRKWLDDHAIYTAGKDKQRSRFVLNEEFYFAFVIFEIFTRPLGRDYK